MVAAGLRGPTGREHRRRQGRAAPTADEERHCIAAAATLRAGSTAETITLAGATPGASKSPPQRAKTSDKLIRGASPLSDTGLLGRTRSQPLASSKPAQSKFDGRAGLTASL